MEPSTPLCKLGLDEVGARGDFVPSTFEAVGTRDNVMLDLAPPGPSGFFGCEETVAKMLVEGPFSGTPETFWYGGKVDLTASVESLAKMLPWTGVTAGV